jgi:asparagine synthase (glutamine-hydrolysing)
MCGINGIINFDHTIDIEVVRQMNLAVKHRGPDGEGIYLSSDQVCGLGHVRLSIIDLEGSKQPLCNENATIWITFNGEIYNYKDLRKHLLSLGHRFQTNGDTETLVHLYEEYGIEMLKHLYGMFAFAIWDSTNKKLFIARDRLGVKPLFFYELHKGLVFSSEQKGILQHPLVKAEASEDGIWHYLTFRSVPAPSTLYKGINKLLPGHYLLFDDKGLIVKKYWEIPINSPVDLSIDDGELIQTTESALKRSIERRMVSDVPLGAFLSGGVDSSLIVALMTTLINEPVRTYSVGFKDFEHSETSYARIVAKQYNTNHHELILSEEVFTDHLESLTYLRDSPLSEPADIPLYLLSKMASNDVKILLSGEGSDELYAGYPKYSYDHWGKFSSLLPNCLKKILIKKIPEKHRKIEVALKALFETDYTDRWPLWFSPFSIEEKKNLFLGQYEGLINPTRAYINEFNLEESLRSFLFCDCKVWLPDNLLDRGDRMTMAASIEGRVPFLDHDLVELAFKSPDRVKIRSGQRKWIIKQIASKYLPFSVTNRPKAGFVMPMSNWFRGKLKDFCYDMMLSGENIPKGIISSPHIRSILDSHCSGKKDYYLQIWTLLGLALWFKTCIDNRNQQ